MFVSVIVPVHNGQDHLARTLAAIRSSDYSDFELIVVDDASADSSVSIARGFVDQLIELKVRRAPGYARNQGAQKSRGDILFFVDADVEIRRQTISRIVEEFSKDPGLAAVFGSYDDAPEHKNFFSQYKNLFHHFVHQKADSEAKTFWAGCGAMRRDVFLENKGFVESFRAPAIEDVILGYSLAERGQRIRLVKDLQVKHLKAWSFWNLLKTDIFQRAIPWTRLTVEKGLPKDLNFKVADRVSAFCAWGLLLSLVFWFFYSFAGIISVLFVAIFLGLNRELYAFFLRKRGSWFVARAVLFHWFYFLYSSFIFILFSLILIFF
jgi:glycosyltransferase involved in cell wall biosynthesis